VSGSETSGLVQAALSGDPEAKGRLLEHLRPRLVLWAASRMSKNLRAHVEPEDMAQEILLAMHKAVDAFEGDSPRAFFGWMFTLAENRIRDTVKSLGRQKRQAAPRMAFSQTSPSQAAVRTEELDRLRTAIEALPADYRRVIQLRRLEDRETREVAELMERSENAVRILYFRAVAELREKLSE